MDTLGIITNRFGTVAGTPQVPTFKKSDYNISETPEGTSVSEGIYKETPFFVDSFPDCAITEVVKLT